MNHDDHKVCFFGSSVLLPDVDSLLQTNILFVWILDCFYNPVSVLGWPCPVEKR